MQRIVPALVVLSAVAAVGCGVPSVAERGAEPIAGTVGVGGMLLDAYAVSPSGRQLLFARANPGELAVVSGADVLAPLYGFALLERTTGRVRDVGVDAAALRDAVEARPALLLGSLCWNDAEDAVRLGVDAGPIVSLDVRASMLEWRLGFSASPPDPAFCPPWQATGPALLEGAGPFRVERRDRSVRVEDRAAPGRVLFDYRGSWLARDTYVRDVRLSPVGGRLAIVLSRGTGSFTGAAELFVVSQEPGEPGLRSLGGPVFQVRWSRRGDELFAIAAAGDDGRQRAIYRWSFEDTPSRP